MKTEKEALAHDPVFSDSEWRVVSLQCSHSFEKYDMRLLATSPRYSDVCLTNYLIKMASEIPKSVSVSVLALNAALGAAPDMNSSGTDSSQPLRRDRTQQLRNPHLEINNILQLQGRIQIHRKLFRTAQVSISTLTNLSSIEKQHCPPFSPLPQFPYL
jgi:hypothetical protein